MHVSEKPKYVEIQPRTRRELEQALASDDANTVCNALYSAAQHESDWRWSQTQCLMMLKHESPLVRSTAVIALGEIAHFRGALDRDVVLPELRRLASDSALGPYVEDVLDELDSSRPNKPE